MGLRFRKSVSLGNGTRINFSKSGVGWSVGNKGARFTKKSNGGYRTTTNIPGTGFSYTKDFGGETGKSKVEEEKIYYSNVQQSNSNISQNSFENKPKRRNGWGIPTPLIFVIVFVIIIVVGLVYVSSKEPAKNESEYDLQFYLKAGTKGSYGRILTYNSGTEFEEKLYAYYVPSGKYIVSNEGSYPTQVNVYSNEIRLVNGWEEPKEVACYVLEKGQSKEIEVKSGFHIEITEPTYIFMKRIKE